jgi:hypothetical protein
MKKLAALLCLGALATGAFAQGTVTFNNNPATLISVGPVGAGVATAANSPGSYYFGLLTSLTGAAGSFTFAQVYGTNNAAAGRFTGGTATLANIAPGTSFSFEVAGWSASLGATFNPAWIANPPNFGTASGSFGLSGIGTAVAGGGTPPAPPGIIFGATGLTSGFNMTPTGVVPEPTSMALAGLGAAALLIFRRRK